MPQRVHNPRYWRSYAEETRTIAEQMKGPQCKRLLTGVSETYAELARRAILRKRTGPIRTPAVRRRTGLHGCRGKRVGGPLIVELWR
jgi:hypothetical protein